MMQSTDLRNGLNSAVLGRFDLSFNRELRFEDKALAIRILPGRSWRTDDLFDTGVPHMRLKHTAVDAITITKILLSKSEFMISFLRSKLPYTTYHQYPVVLSRISMISS